MPISMPIIRATTTAAEAMPCCAAGTTRSVADVSGRDHQAEPEPRQREVGVEGGQA